MGEKKGLGAAFRKLQDGEYAPLKSLLVMVSLEFAGFSMLIPVLPFFGIDELGLKPTELGYIYTAFSLAQLVGGYVFGRLSDAYGRRPIIIFGFFWAALGFGLTSIVQDFWGLFLVRTLQGLSGGTMALCQAFVLDLVTPEERPTFLGMFGAVTGVAFIFGPGIGGVLVGLGFARRSIFVVSGSLCMLATVYGYFSLQESLPPAKRRGFTLAAETSASDWDAVNPGLSFTWLARFLLAAASGVLFATYAFLVRDLFGWSDMHFAAVLVACGVGSATMQLLVFPALTDWLGVSTVCTTGTLFGALAYLLYPEPTIAVHLAGVACYVLAMGLTEPAIPVLVGVFASSRHLGFGNGVAVSARSLATAITPVLAAMAYEASPRAAYYGGSGIFLCSTLAALGTRFCAKLPAEETLPIAKAE